jgi:hypothetical protein
MATNQSRILIGALAFFLIFLTGFLLRRAGKPYPGLLLNIHKLISLGAIVYFGITFSELKQSLELTLVDITISIVALVFFVATIVTGGLTSLAKPMPKIISGAHKLLPYLTTLCSAITFYLLFNHIN